MTGQTTIAASTATTSLPNGRIVTATIPTRGLTSVGTDERAVDARCARYYLIRSQFNFVR